MATAGDKFGIKILVVDDDPSIGELMKRFLEVQGYQPTICNHPQEALEVTIEKTFNLAFIDINLPEMNGLDLAARLKLQNPQCEVVFITGYGSFDNAIQAIKIGAYDYLRKPFGISELELCLKRFQERQELIEQVRRAEQRYFHLVQNIPSIVFVIRGDFRLEFISRASESMLGYTLEEALNDPDWFLQRIHPSDTQRIKRLFVSAFQTSSSRFSADCRLFHRDGHVVYSMVGSIAPIEFGMDVAVDRLQGMIIDITDRVFLEKSVVQKEKLKILNSISAEVAHEIRNPLVSIGGFARRLRKRFSDLPEGDIILKESERLEKILQRLAEYLKPVEVNYSDCIINDIVSECVEELTPDLNKNGVTWRMSLDSSLSMITADMDILGRIFYDLIRNSVKEAGKGGKLVIRTFESDMNLHVEFLNTCKRGKTIDPEPFFMPFNSGDHEIGLPISYRLLKNMGGLLSFSQGENEMVFTVSLPKKAPAVPDR